AASTCKDGKEIQPSNSPTAPSMPVIAKSVTTANSVVRSTGWISGHRSGTAKKSRPPPPPPSLPRQSHENSTRVHFTAGAFDRLDSFSARQLGGPTRLANQLGDDAGRDDEPATRLGVFHGQLVRTLQADGSDHLDQPRRAELAQGPQACGH